MAILIEETVEISGGFSKKINKAAEGLMFNVLQQHQYSKPIPSTIRELVCNGLDSITEKNMAKRILSGEASVEDYYADMEGAIYDDSRFDREYYDPKWLSADDDVIIQYEDGGELGKDRVIITDYGVGLGGERLENYFNLGYSSKRLMNLALGKFGIGAKAPLSLGIPFYTMTTRYNGREYCFNIYAHKVESIIPKFNIEHETQNPSHVFKNRYIAYYRTTTEPNMVRIEIAAKKHHRQQYIEAVTGQLLYFNNVRLFAGTEISVRANIMYEDDLIVLSSNSSYSKPHILLNGVNYGYIDFNELELEQKLGNIGVKVDPSKVSINPSRESLIWDDITREVVINKFNEVLEIAQNLINSELKETTDFLQWIRVCMTSLSRSDRADNTVLGRLSKIVDMSKVELIYPLNKAFRFNKFLLDGVVTNVVSTERTRRGAEHVTKVSYTTIGVINAISEGKPIVVAKTSMLNRKNKYILSKVYPQGFVLIRLQPEADGKLTAEDITNQARIDEVTTGTREQARQRIADLQNYLYNSEGVVFYEDIEVPEDFKANEDSDEEVEVEEEKTVEEKMSAAERRKLDGLTVLHTPRIAYNKVYIPVPSNAPEGTAPTFKHYEMVKVETPVREIDNWSNPEIYWSNQDYEELLHTASIICRPFMDPQVYNSTLPSKMLYDFSEKGYKTIYLAADYPRMAFFQENSAVRLIKIAQDNVKYYRDFKHITKFFKEIHNKTIVMADVLVRWNTSRLVSEGISQMKFLEGFATITPERHSKYMILKRYVETNWRPFTTSTSVGGSDVIVNQITTHMDKVAKLQLFVRDNPTEVESIAELVQELFEPPKEVEIKDGRSLDLNIYDMYLEMMDWVSPICVLLNMCERLTEDKGILADQEQEIMHYLSYKNVTL